MNEQTENSFEFAEFRFDGSRRRLTRGDVYISLSPKATDLLILLLSNDGRFVAKEEIFEKIWPDTFVEDGVLTQNVYTLRKALGNDANGDSLVETRSRLGYRISVPIRAFDADMSEEDETTIDEIVFGGDDPAVNSPGKRSLKRFGIVLILAAILFATTGFVGYRYFGSSLTAFFRKKIEVVKFSRLTNTGDLSEAALSPDGKFLAFVKNKSVFLKDIVSNREIPLEIPGFASFGSLRFSADGNYLYFCDSDTYLNLSRIFRVSRFGGDAVMIGERNRGQFALSPDNKLLAFYTTDQSDLQTRLVIKNLETQELREIYRIESQFGYCNSCAPAWSPDGKKILHITEQLSNFTNQLYALDVATGRNEEIKLPRLRRISNASWFPDGQSFALCASTEDVFQIWRVEYPNGDARQITNGLESYQNPMVSADGKAILTIQRSETSNVFVTDESNIEDQRQLTVGNTNNFGTRSLLWIDERSVLFSGQAADEVIDNFWLLDINEKAKRQITFDKEFRPNRPSTDGKSIYFNLNRNRVANITRIDTNGENRSQVTDNAEAARQSPQVSPDGSTLYYLYRDKAGVKIMRRNLAAQQEEILIEDPSIQCGFFLLLSPDGRWLACPNWRVVAPPNNTEILLMSVESRAVVKAIRIARSAPYLQFSPDSKAIDFLTEADGSAAIMRKGFDESEAKPVVRLSNDVLFNFAWSKNGKQLALSRGRRFSDAVLVTVVDK